MAEKKETGLSGRAKEREAVGSAVQRLLKKFNEDFHAVNLARRIARAQEQTREEVQTENQHKLPAAVAARLEKIDVQYDFGKEVERLFKDGELEKLFDIRAKTLTSALKQALHRFKKPKRWNATSIYNNLHKPRKKQ